MTEKAFDILAKIVMATALLLMLILAVKMFLGPPDWEQKCRDKDGIPSYEAQTRRPICMLGPFDMEQRSGIPTTD